MVSDSPQSYANQPEFKFIKDVPAAWDETRELNGEPGEYVTIARRRGAEWYLGSITNWSARALHVPLGFLGAGTYTAEIYQDAGDADRKPTGVVMRKQSVKAGDTLDLNLAKGGGCAIRFLLQHNND
jgi:alpha-glucosidase